MKLALMWSPSLSLKDESLYWRPVPLGAPSLFAQLMDFLPWSTFARIVAGYGGDARVRTLCCAEQYRAMAFAQLTYRRACANQSLPVGARVETLSHGFS